MWATLKDFQARIEKEQQESNNVVVLDQHRTGEPEINSTKMGD